MRNPELGTSSAILFCYLAKMDSPYYGSSESDSEYDDDFFLGEQYDPLFSCTYNSYRDSHRQRSNDLLDGLLGSAPGIIN